MIHSKNDENTIGLLMRTGFRRLEEAGIENAFGEARDIMLHLLECQPVKLFLMEEEPASEDLKLDYMSIIEERTKHIPLQYLLGETCFMGYDFLCRENVLIPRFDTENLVEAALDAASSMEKKNLRVLDMCTGTGCIGISYFLERKKEGFDDKVTLVDISEYAIELAKDNAEKLSADVEIVRSDLFSGLHEEKFDMILSNPPYIPTIECETLMEEVKDYEPRLALDGDDDGLKFYRNIISGMKPYLQDKAYVIFEIGCDQYEAVKSMLNEAGYTDVKCIKDLSGLDRCVVCRI